MPPLPRPQHSSSPTAGLHLRPGQLQQAGGKAEGRQNVLERARCPPVASLGTPAPAAAPRPQPTEAPGTRRGWQGTPREGSLSAAAATVGAARVRALFGHVCGYLWLCLSLDASSVRCPLQAMGQTAIWTAHSPAGSPAHPPAHPPHTPLPCWHRRAAGSSGRGPELPLRLTGRGLARRGHRLRGCQNKQSKQAG